jgi:alkylation response protein AidB-like acyl-CoA dehydrogenase
VDLYPTEEQTEIARTVADFLVKELPAVRQRELFEADEPWTAEVRVKCAELGWFALGVSEANGGVGYTVTEEVLLFRELGRSLAPGPFLSTVLGVHIALAAGEEELAQEIMAGEAGVALGQARRADSVLGDTVTGAFNLFDYPGARYVLLIDVTGATLLQSTVVGSVDKHLCVDPAVRFATTSLSGAAAKIYLPAQESRIYERGLVLIAAMAAGIAEATLDLAAEHARNRVQFGKPIGVHQAIKHRCADMAIRAEAARWQSFFAAITLRDNGPDADFQAASAKVVAVDRAIHNSADCIQIHGGLGYTWEHDAHRYLKRAHVLDQYLGPRNGHLERLIGLRPAEQR